CSHADDRRSSLPHAVADGTGGCGAADPPRVASPAQDGRVSLAAGVALEAEPLVAGLVCRAVHGTVVPQPGAGGQEMNRRARIRTYQLPGVRSESPIFSECKQLDNSNSTCNTRGILKNR